ncbi:tRNA (adenosine(37)-N6)-threonylcarbamoyltransferase complex ATPase subunit type 1 TsaE [uncultured Roseobacter sp.]|uniref:tRNA (adenosine(37)-N6)-threonylcarbamoyltransferase complex ATPase subunit type 1 TsaE n=1 Tax=uncultured Roseobacter sp. TaxID=114847 RepID=UPI0026075D6C|nr:tRNA (adenosine(37)-N6)-threonylcarbamoyltransferase complex ATPase subunit type 1 TsaE [uncultured Roseobacter sp.]
MNPRSLSAELPTPEATGALAAKLAVSLVPGDVLLLDGDVGAGKTHFARHLIQAILTHPEDVPSPTFTLVQEYETTRGALWHSDLYRLSSVTEIEELGLTGAFDTAICLVEWPDRLGDLRPGNALELNLKPGAAEEHRKLTVTWTDPRWTDRVTPWLS